MHDYLVSMGQNKTAKHLIKNLGITLPQKLKRQSGAWDEHFLGGKQLGIGGSGHLHRSLGPELVRAGATVSLVGVSEKIVRDYAGLNHVKVQEGPALTATSHALLFDATGLESVEELEQLYLFLHKNIRLVEPNGRIILLGPAPGVTLASQVISHALEGIARSLAKEVGKRGATAHLVMIAPGADSRVAGVVLFLLSARSAFISGQTFTVTDLAKGPSGDATALPLKGKIALVTGAARGIGAATSRTLAREGAKVVCLDRPDDEKALSGVALEISGQVLLQDITDSEAPHAIQSFATDKVGGFDIIVHNAGITRDKTIANMEEKQWNAALNVNLASVLRITEALLTRGLNDNGRLICLSSIAGIAGNFGQTNYAAAKSGLIGFINHLAPLVGERGITANAIAPGFIETRLTASIPFVTREAARRLSNLGQGGLPEDVAEAIAFVASPAAVGLTGSVIRVCGGALIGK